MNTYLQSMKNVLTNYYNAAKSYEEKEAQAKQRYQPDVAAEEIKKLDAALEADKRAAIGAITEAKDKAIEAARRWGALDGSKIDDGDMKLLKFDLSPEQFEAMVERHKKNGTMCFILAQYAEKHNRQETKPGEFGLTGRLNPLIIPTVEEKINAYTKFAESAISTIDNMTGFGWGKGVGNPVSENSVKNFGEPNPINYALLEAIE